MVATGGIEHRIWLLGCGPRLEARRTKWHKLLHSRARDVADLDESLTTICVLAGGAYDAYLCSPLPTVIAPSQSPIIDHQFSMVVSPRGSGCHRPANSLKQ